MHRVILPRAARARRRYKTKCLHAAVRTSQHQCPESHNGPGNVLANAKYNLLLDIDSPTDVLLK